MISRVCYINTVGKFKDKIKNSKFNTNSHPTRNDIYEVGWKSEFIIKSKK